MSTYENRPVPEGINYSRENPLKEFLLLLLAAGLVLLLVLFLLSLTAQKLAPLIPFDVEAELADSFSAQLPASATSERGQQIETWLQGLAQSLTENETLPEGMTLTVHFVESETVNAFATLGGNIYILDGLLQGLDSENALAMVLAHEIAHVVHRDPIVAAGRGLTVTLALASLSGFAQTGAADWLIQQLGLATVSSFSRSQERAADGRALAMVQALYGNVSGAEQVFTLLGQSGLEPPELFSTHPLSDNRIAAIRAFAEAHPQRGQPKPLPAFVTPLKPINP